MTWHARIEKNSVLGFGVAALLAASSLTGCSDDASNGPMPDVVNPEPIPDAGPDVVNPAETAAAPVFGLAGGTFTSAQSVAVHTATAGATIRYTLDGSAPGSTSAVYSAPLSIAKTTTLKAIALKAGLQNSAVQSETYIIDIPIGTVEPVQFSVNAGDYSNDIDVTLSSNTADAAICYTLDASASTSTSTSASTPACDTAARCAGGSSTYDAASPLRIKETGTSLRAIACKSRMSPSSETRADYTLTAAAPEFDPAPGAMDPSKPHQVTVTTSTVGGTIHYTTDGSTPDCHSTAAPPIGILPNLTADTTTIKALTCKGKYANSSVVTGTYAIGKTCTGNFNVFTQAQLEPLSRCEVIEGTLSIHGNEIRDLAPLRHLSRVSLSLQVMKTSLTSLQGLEGLTSVGAAMYVADNSKLANLDALSSLETVEESLSLYRNAVTEWIGPSKLTKLGELHIGGEPKLQHVGGFVALAEIGKYLEIDYNPALTTIDGMPALTKIGGMARIDANGVLESVSGFGKVQEIGGLSVSGNTVLSRFLAFSQTTAVHGYLSLYSPKLSQLDLKNVKTVDGTLEIATLRSLTSLEGLSGLTTAKELVIFGDHGFADLKGLERLTTVQGELAVTQTSGKLVSLDGLDNLTSVGGLRIDVNSTLRSLRGLGKLAKVTAPESYVSITRNAALTEIGSLDALRSVMWLQIDSNFNLTHLNGLHNLQSVSRFLLQDNFNLAKLDGLDALSDIDAFAFITKNGLTSLDELRALKRIGGGLHIFGENALTNLAGLEGLTELGGNLDITDNAILPTCRAEGLAARLRALGYQGSVTIERNGGTSSCTAP